MKNKTLLPHRHKWLLALLCLPVFSAILMSSSHREAPMIANDPQADNTDLYAFRSPTNPNKVVIIANYIPLQSPQGGPNFYHFGEDVRYEIHIDNNPATKGDDIIYRFLFSTANSRRDPNTFFNIRLGKENLRTRYTVDRSMDGGKSWLRVLYDGIVPPPNIGPRSISSPVGLNAPSYDSLMYKNIQDDGDGERIFAGPVDDPFFVDLGGIFDLGDAPRQMGRPVDGLKCMNVSTIAMEIDISRLQKDHKKASQAKNILDPDFVIGVWASASRQRIKTLNNATDHISKNFESYSGDWVQVSRLGMPLTNEAVVPIAYKDYWNRLTPYDDLSELKEFGNFFYNPELALYMDDSQFGGAIPAFKPLRIQRKSLGQFDFGNGGNGLYGLKGSAALNGTALAENAFGSLLLPASKSPRSVDLWPIFHTGVPNLPPYQLATGKGGNPLAAGKPFISNFLPNGGDMLRLNMAVPVTKRDDPDFSSLGLIQAAVLGLTDKRFNGSSKIQFIPNMDGFPNGRRLEDDVTRIELQAVSGIVLAAIGLWYDDFDGTNPVTKNLLSVYNYTTGIEKNDTAFKSKFPFEQTPWAGTHVCSCSEDNNQKEEKRTMGSFPVAQKLGIATPEVSAISSPNPVVNTSTLKYRVDAPSQVKILLYDVSGKALKILADKKQDAGTYTLQWNASSLTKGTYYIAISKNGSVTQTLSLVKAK
ncbi:DUF4331 family protein [Segetibacter koreensis]|uniref:DUF4331 family protein n=1 Tax=Segetibacter koreensis TaxID=398037 RepID=UPI00037C15E7|nr:DUF4331 family protein [Segetibacter koreensis]